MSGRLNVVTAITLLWLAATAVDCDMNKNRAYINLAKPVPCIRRFNATHQIGCAGVRTGIVYAVRDQAEYSRLERLAAAEWPASESLIVVATPVWFARLVDWFRQTAASRSIVSGLVLVEKAPPMANASETPTPAAYSDDLVSPNAQLSLYQTAATTMWNPSGRAAMFEDFGIPMYAIVDESEAKQTFDDCYGMFNRVKCLYY